MSLAREAWPLLAMPALLLALSLWLLPAWVALLPAALLLFVAWFFRDPRRSTPADADALIAPADGRIIRAGPDRISIFMNVFNVHVCRTPVAGTVTGVSHTPGRFLAAFKDDAPEHNERTEVRVEDADGTVRFVLIAGLVARRIVCKVAPGQKLRAGERVGLIRFGSRVDIDVPEGGTVRVAIGDRVVAGETVIARRFRL
jgi:phosphatidylserine decarboxylase